MARLRARPGRHPDRAFLLAANRACSQLAFRFARARAGRATMLEEGIDHLEDGAPLGGAVAALAVLQQHTVEHGEDGLLLGLGEAADALELALGPRLPGCALVTPSSTSVGTAKNAASLGTRATGSRSRPTS